LGVTEKDIATLAYKGKNWQAIANRIQLAVGTARETAQETRANPLMTEQGQRTGTPNQQRVQATE
jgi:transposase